MVMKIAVAGLWHLGTVTAGCLASIGHSVTGFDRDANIVCGLRENRLPIEEPGLRDRIAEAAEGGNLHFTSDPGEIADCQILWVCYDTPVDENDVADSEFVLGEVISLLPQLRDHAIVLISSQIPVGSTASLEDYCRLNLPSRSIAFAYSPENLRLGKAVEVFTKPDRVVVGVRSTHDRERLAPVWTPFTDQVIWMSVESAEMTKHALNGFLATSIAFINEIAVLCEKVGADALEIERGLKSDQRIGKRAYLHAGTAFSGGTLARDVVFLQELASRKGTSVPLLNGVKQSNDHHQTWLPRRLREELDALDGKTIAVLGLTYKPQTNTLRRSSAVEICRWLVQQGAIVHAYDPAIQALPPELVGVILLHNSAEAALKNASAALITTQWLEFQSLTADTVVTAMKQPCIFDPFRHLDAVLAADPRIRYFSIGKRQ
jgi:UDPglucose 6-dehydrogenase